MTPISVITFRLFRGQTLLGTLVQPMSEAKVAWQGGAFEAAAEFERVRPLFDNELHLLTANRQMEWKEIWDEIQRPGLRLEPVAGGEPITKFLIHIENDRAWWKSASAETPQSGLS